MNRQEVVIALAKINMMNKQVAYWIDLNQELDKISIALEIEKVPRWIEEILEYMKGNSCRGVVKFAQKMYDIEYLKNALKESKKRWSKTTIILLSDFCMSMDKLFSASNIYNKMYKRGPYGELEELLSNEKAANLLQRAVDAGYLDCNYYPKASTTPFQLKAIAWGVGQQIKIPWRQQWTTFERQWKTPRIGTVPFPEKRTQALEDVKALYPEVDYSPLIAIRENEFFNMPTDESRINELFLALFTYDYIDKKTTFSQFQKIFGIQDENTAFKPVNWIKDQRKLTYFVRFAFGKKNKSIWLKTKHCFTVNGNVPNLGSLKSGFQAIVRDNPEIEKYDPCLITLANQFNRKQ